MTRFSFLPCLILFAAVSLAAPQPGDFFASGPSTAKCIALTFDDGPGPNTKEFLDLLDKHNVKATFFVLGSQVKTRPAVAKEIVARGHELANHTWEHRNFKSYLKGLKKEIPDEIRAVAKARDELAADMRKTNDVIEKITGVKPTICRMPHGIDGPWIHEAAKEAGLVLVNWTHGADWTGEPAERLVPDYLKAIKPGAVILLHDGWPKSDKSLRITEAVIKAAIEAGYEIVPVGKLIEKGNPH